MGKSELENIFTHHTPKDGQGSRYDSIRAAALHFAEYVDMQCPASREKSLAMTSIQQAMMWANASIAINE